MDIRVEQGQATTFATDFLAVPVVQGDAPSGTAAAVDAALGGHLADAMGRKEFTGKAGQTIAFPGPEGGAGRVCFIGVGKADAITTESLRRFAGKAVRAANQGRFASVALTSISDAAPYGDLSPVAAGEELAVGLVLGSYRFSEYKTEGDATTPDSVQSATVLTPDGTNRGAVAEGVDAGQIIAGGTRLAMDMANHPSAVVTPTRLAEEAIRLGQVHNFPVEVLEKEQMEELGMGGMVGVGQGSDEAPKFIIMEYKGGKGAPVVLVGKSITFDSGGISIKPSAGMEEMKGDMSGGAAVLGTMQAVAELALPINVTAILTAAENMPSGTAINPGDVLHMHSGLTVEVINTDAEGRLVLADGLSYGQKFKPRCMVDIATLTGACVVALGHHAIGLLGTDDGFKKTFSEVGETTGERVWELPLWEVYADDLKSDIADIKNTGGRAGGTIAAACFLQKFVGDIPWIHLDIASTAWSDKASDYLPKGSHGTGVRLMTGFLRKLVG